MGEGQQMPVLTNVRLCFPTCFATDELNARPRQSGGICLTRGKNATSCGCFQLQNLATFKPVTCFGDPKASLHLWVCQFGRL